MTRQAKKMIGSVSSPTENIADRDVRTRAHSARAKGAPQARPTFATYKRFLVRGAVKCAEGKMLTGLLGTAMLIGMISAGLAFSARGSFLVALLVYSLTGTCVLLAAMLVAAVRDSRDERHEKQAKAVLEAA